MKKPDNAVDLLNDFRTITPVIDHLGYFGNAANRHIDNFSSLCIRLAMFMYVFIYHIPYTIGYMVLEVNYFHSNFLPKCPHMQVSLNFT